MTNRVSAAPSEVPEFRIRRASAQDADGIVTVLQQIVSERVHSAIEQPWSTNEQRAYLESLSAREAFHVAVDRSARVIGFQSLDLWSPHLVSTAHVGQLGTFLLTDWRRRGVGHALFRATQAFARSSGYRKLLIQVRMTNTAAQAFYQQLGFSQCGRLTRQVVINGEEDDEILMEFFLSEASCVQQDDRRDKQG
jgi:L-amino acid N-acyltransferase YncA